MNSRAQLNCIQYRRASRVSLSLSQYKYPPFFSRLKTLHIINGGKAFDESIFEAKVFPPPFRAAEIEESFLFSSLSKMDSQARFMTSLENAVFELEVRSTKCGHK